MFKNKFFIILLLLACGQLFALKPKYGGELRLFLNEPSSYMINVNDYSSLIFCSLIYENFFYATGEGVVFSNIFQQYYFDRQAKEFHLILKKNLAFSDGSKIEPVHIINSLRFYLSQMNLSAHRLKTVLKNISASGNDIVIQLQTDRIEPLELLLSPSLVLLAPKENVFSGPFIPGEWKRQESLELIANRYYPGGRAYIDKIRIYFQEQQQRELDLFLTDQQTDVKNFDCIEAGILQNFYLAVFDEEVSKNLKLALFSLFKLFGNRHPGKFHQLNALGSDESSPVSLRQEIFNEQKIRNLLKSSNTNLLAASSLAYLEGDFQKFFKELSVDINLNFIELEQLTTYLKNFKTNFLLISKIFLRIQSELEKLDLVLREVLMTGSEERVFQFSKELEELKGVPDRQVVQEGVARISAEILKRGLVLPLFQKKYFFLIKKKLSGRETDLYARMFFHKLHFKND